MKVAVREKLIDACRDYINLKVSVIKKAMDGLKEDLEGESKSSAGDKYETGREMINIEWNKLGIQLNQYDQLGKVLNRIEEHKSNGNVILGSVVFTNPANYFISIPAGEIVCEGTKFYAVGIQSPIAQAMIGKKAGDIVVFNGQNIEIKEIT